MRSKPFYSLLLAVCLFNGAANRVTAQVASSSLAPRVNALFAEWNKAGSPGVAIGVVHQGRLVYAKGFGEADVETGARIGSQTIFHAASLAKQFTAYAIVLLARQGKLSLDDDIRTYLPHVPDVGKKITIRHLIHHTSGLRDQWALLTMAGRRMDDVITKEHIFNLIRRQKELNFEPGSEFAYSNTNYTLLAEIVSRVGQQPFPDWMQEHVFGPLGMKNTMFYDDHERIVKNRAYSFYKDHGQSNTLYRKSVLSYANSGATSLLTTIPDLAKWVATFRNARVGDSTPMGQMLQRGRLTRGDTLPYSFGLFHGDYKGLAQYAHNGADAGYRSFLSYFPKADYGFIVLSNAAGFDAGKATYDLANLYLAGQLKEPSPPKPTSISSAAQVYKIDEQLLNQYVGEYQLAPGFVLSFKREQDRLIGQAPGQAPFELVASSDTTFQMKGEQVRVTFHKSANGKVTKLTLHQNGEHPASRVEAYTPTKVELQTYLGKYYSPELETIYTISLKNDTLQLDHVDSGETALKPLARDRLEFPLKLIPSFTLSQTVVMVRDNQGQILGLRISNGLVRNLWFMRLASDFGEERLPKDSKE
jgi:CubicO group peptidase (beta-lactamase class C family)